MANRNYKVGQNRSQSSLLPPSVDEYVSENNPVRAIDAYVVTLDLVNLEIQKSHSGLTAGQPAYHPSLLIKLYLYGYMNGIRSSRKLEREAARNLEVIWLVDSLRPSYKTIANFRKDNGVALKAINKDFILLCKQLNLFAGDEVAVDGSFFKADACKDSIYTAKKLEQQLAELDKKIEAYQQQLAEQDATDDKAGLGSLVDEQSLADKIARIKAKQAEKKALQNQLNASPDRQISTVDPDARLLTKRGQTTAGYNVQIAVDSQHKLLVAVEVTQDGNDTQQLMPMLEKAQAVLQSEHLTGLADSGYYSGEQIKQAREQGIEIYVPIPQRRGPTVEEGRLTRDQFIYDAENDCYHCPQGERLARYGKPREQSNRNVWNYKSKRSACNHCSLRSQCLGGKAFYKKLERWEHEAIVDQHREHMKAARGIMKKRGSLVEHPFGTLKHRAGMHHFLMRGLEKCRGEFSLMALCYNFTRVLNILGVAAFRDYCAQRLGNGETNQVFA
ncbi:IS1182 family transposase [Methylomonas montana]|uniref:IS1182 family transposase n=1 Tax=Methylomonas montana TaxID=3058963 RepID=UPI00265AB469|nr:IS1182 family transposase [Methylomonas montana]WKJ90261.1 IS1182 family transposase [Methylomonas montana]